MPCRDSNVLCLNHSLTVEGLGQVTTLKEAPSTSTCLLSHHPKKTDTGSTVINRQQQRWKLREKEPRGSTLHR